MKRNVCFKVLSVFLLFLVVWVPLLPVLNGTDASASQADYGDVNGDGEVTVRDAILVLKHVSGLLNLEEKYDNGAYERANVFTGTDFVGVGDAVFILRYVVGLQDELPTDSSDYEEGLGGDVYYEWGEQSSYSFTVKVNVYNEGSDTANNVQVNLPMLENDSPYQDTNLIDTNYPNTSSSGRISTFNLDDLSPGQSKTLEVNYNIDVRPVSVNSDANGTIEDAQNIFDRYAGSGNCHELATQFVDHCQDEGIEARVVTGFARPRRGDSDFRMPFQLSS